MKEKSNEITENIKLNRHNLQITLFILLFLAFMLTSCKPNNKITFTGRLVFLLIPGSNNNATDTNAPGIYELSQGQLTPILLWGNLGIIPTSAVPTISPDGKMALIRGLLSNYEDVYYLIDLQSGKGYLFPLDRIKGNAVFSPDNKYLAYVSSGGDGLFVIDLEKVNYQEIEEITLKDRFDGWWALNEYTTEVFQGKCTGYVGCSVSECLSMYSPFWVDNKTLLIVHDPNIINPNYQFPDMVGGCSDGGFGRQYMLSVVNVDGKIISNHITPYTIEITYPSKSEVDPNMQGGSTFLFLGEKNGIESNGSTQKELYRLDTKTLLEKNDTTRNSLGFTSTDVYSVSPDKKTLIRYYKNWEIVDILSGSVTKLNSQPAITDISNCVWSIDQKTVACIGRVGKEIQLFLLPLSGESPMILKSWKYEAFGGEKWYLLAWQP